MILGTSEKYRKRQFLLHLVESFAPFQTFFDVTLMNVSGKPSIANCLATPGQK